MKNDRRQQPRKIPQALAFIQVEKDEGGRVLNISESGLCFEVFSTIRVTEAVRFWFTFNLSDRIEALGRLVWIDATKRIGGLTFTKVSHTARKQIRYWIGRMPLSEPPIVRNTPVQVPEVRIPSSPLQTVEIPLPVPEIRSSNVPLQTPEVRIPIAPLQALEVRTSNALSQPPETRGSNPTLWTRPSANPAQASLPAPKFEISERAASPLTTSGILGHAAGSSSEAHLIPLERHRRASRSHFLRGLLLGVGLSAAVAVPLFMSMQAGRPNLTTRPPERQATAADPTAGVQSANSSPQPMPASFAPAAKSHDSRTNSSRPTGHDADPLAAAAGRSPSSGAGSSDSPPVDPYAPNDATRGTKSWKSPKQLWAAVQAGNTNAAVILADHYIHGDGVPVNCDQARVLLLVASEKNNKAAIQKLRDLDKTGCPQTQTQKPSPQ